MPPSSVTPPVYTYDRSHGSAVIGGSFYTGTVYPAEYRGNFFFADYVGNWIQRVVVDAHGAPQSIQPFATDVDAPVRSSWGRTACCTTCHSRPASSSASGSTAYRPWPRRRRLYGYSPLIGPFSSAGSIDSGGGPLSYLWDFGDGTTRRWPIRRMCTPRPRSHFKPS